MSNIIEGSLNPMLRREMEQFDFSNLPTDPVQLTLDMIKAMDEGRGVGLSANQMQLPYRVFVMAGDPSFACFNPRITTTGDELVVMEEGCLSYPGMICKVKRPQSIRVRFQDPYGNAIVKKFTGMSARIFQHELDHLNGVVFYEQANRYHKEMAIKKYKKLQKRLAAA